MMATVMSYADYVAYAIVKDEEMPLPESLDKVDFEALINMKWGEFSGGRVRVGVLPVDNTSGSASYTVSGPDGQVASYSVSGYGDQVPVNGIESMITDVLHRSGRFNIVERTQIANVLGEQDLGASGRVAQPSAAKVGKVLGAQYLIQGVVTSYEPNFKGKKGGLGGITRGLFGGARAGKTQSMIGMNFRLIDAETSEILFTKQVDVVMSETSFSLGAIGWGGGGAAGGFLSGYSKTPIGQAVMAAVNIGSYELVKQVGTAPVEGSVVKADAGKVYVNLGQDVVNPGDTLTALAKGEELIDPDTGLSLGGQDTKIGTLEVKTVEEKFCIASPVGFDATKLNRGDRIVSDVKPPELKYAASWAGKERK